MAQGKVQVKPKEVVQDIRECLDDESLMKKFGLSPRQLQSLFKKLVEGGYIEQSELEARAASLAQEKVETDTEVIDVEPDGHGPDPDKGAPSEGNSQILENMALLRRIGAAIVRGHWDSVTEEEASEQHSKAKETGDSTGAGTNSPTDVSLLNTVFRFGPFVGIFLVVYYISFIWGAILLIALVGYRFEIIPDAMKAAKSDGTPLDPDEAQANGKGWKSTATGLLAQVLIGFESLRLRVKTEGINRVFSLNKEATPFSREEKSFVISTTAGVIACVFLGLLGLTGPQNAVPTGNGQPKLNDKEYQACQHLKEYMDKYLAAAIYSTRKIELEQRFTDLEVEFASKLKGLPVKTIDPLIDWRHAVKMRSSYPYGTPDYEKYANQIGEAHGKLYNCCGGWH